MGSDDAPLADNDEKPLHQFDISYSYWMARCPVTNAQFNEFVAVEGYKERRYWVEAAEAGVWQDGGWVKAWNDNEPRDRPYNFGEPFNLPNHPVVGVMWYEALAFTRWLTGRWRNTGLLPDGWAVHLPSEAEWAKAARGGIQVSNTQYRISNPGDLASNGLAITEMAGNPNSKRRYPWGDGLGPNLANYRDTGIQTTSAVGCFLGGASPYGVLLSFE